MHHSAASMFDAAQNDNHWAKSDPVDALIDPPDLTEALAASGGSIWWLSAAPSYRRNVLRWIASAKQGETRQKRISSVAALAAEGKRVPQY